MTATPTIEIHACDPEAGLPVVVGLPLQQGFVRDPHALRVTSPSGQPCAATARATNRWPDGSVRWALLTLMARERGLHQVSTNTRNSSAAPGLDAPAVSVAQGTDTLTIDNTLLRVTLSTTGPGPIRAIVARGHNYLAGPADLRWLVNDADTTHEPQPRQITVLESSPLRARVRIAGAHHRPDGSRLLNYRLDVELWAGWPTLRLDYQFFHLEPGQQNEQIAIDQISMRWNVNLGASDPADVQRHFQQSYYSTLYVPRQVHNPGRVALVADESCGPAHVEDPAMLLDDLDYPSHLRPPLVGVADWLGIRHRQRAIYARMQDFIQLRPKRLASAGSSLDLDIWPATAGPLQLPQGRSRRQVLTLTFSDQGFLEPAQIEARLDAPLHEGRATIDPAWLREAGEFELDRCMAPAAHVRFEKYLRRLVSLDTPQDMFNLGDTIDSGYSRTYLPIPNNSVLRRNAPALPRVFMASNHSPFWERALPELYEPVWTNNEYDAIFALCTELMRTGRRDLWTLARWSVRHAIEVDFVHLHHDPQQHRATPQHSVNHNRSGAIPSHFWTQGLLQYYCLTGDPDVLEVAMALGDKIIENFTLPDRRNSFWSFTRELGWPVLALAHLYEVTSEERYAKQLDEVLDYCMNYPRTPEFDRNLVPFLWAWSCMFEGADLYQRRTGRTDIARWLEAFCTSQCQHLLQLHSEGRSLTIMAPMVMAVGYERTGNPDFLRAGLACIEEWLDTEGWVTPPHEVKPMAITYRGLVRFLHHATQANILDHLEFASARDTSPTGAELNR